MDGRDIGTVVLPGADVKIFLAARPRKGPGAGNQELREKGMEADFRAGAFRPDRPATGTIPPARSRPCGRESAVCLDTTGNTREQSIRLIENIIKERLSDADFIDSRVLWPFHCSVPVPDQDFREGNTSFRGTPR
jgi:cytidylate kinase